MLNFYKYHFNRLTAIANPTKVPKSAEKIIDPTITEKLKYAISMLAPATYCNFIPRLWLVAIPILSPIINPKPAKANKNSNESYITKRYMMP